MSEQKNPAIKLFGKTISLPPSIDMVAADAHHHHEQQSSSSTLTDYKCTSGEELMASVQESDPINPTEEESVEQERTFTGTETLKTHVASSDTFSTKDTTGEEQTESSDSTEMLMKKPEKILPCPRCSSMDTKFCYYNNYNVKQPRHFCKSCQRFWTAGGTMRNMAVGSGRRKNKGNCPSNPDLTKRPHLFPLAQGYGPPRISCFPDDQPSQWNAVHFSSPASQDVTFSSSGAVQFYPANSYCISAVPSTWRTAPLPSPIQSMASTDLTSSLGKHRRDGSLLQSDIYSTDVESGAKRYVMPDKALKIDHISDAATRNIRSSMGIKDSNEGSFMGSSHFKAFYPIHHGKNHIGDNSLILQANPAAFCRSMSFRELY